MAVSETDRSVARAAADAFGGIPAVWRHADEGESNVIDILSCPDRPTAGLTTYSTLGLYRVPNLLDGEDIRVELAGVASSGAAEFANVLGEAAMLVMKDHWLAAPGVTYPGLIWQRELTTTMDSMIWVPPFPWPELGSVDLGGDLRVHWLLGVPIAEAERQFVLEHGFDSFTARMEAQDVEYWRLDRPAIV